MNEEIWNSLKKDIEEQVDRGMKSRVLVPEWKPFKHKVKNSDGYRLIRDNGGQFLSHESGTCFRLRQTKFHSHYELGDISEGYGFRELECIACGCPMNRLLYDTDNELWYCPRCG